MSDRKHRATGKPPPGGKRPGAGRPPGSTNALPYGVVQAMKALNLRVPEGRPEPEKAVANRAFERIIDVMEEKVPFKDAPGVLKAASILREEICGPVKQRIEHSFNDATDEQLQAKKAELLASLAVPKPEGE